METLYARQSRLPPVSLHRSEAIFFFVCHANLSDQVTFIETGTQHIDAFHLFVSWLLSCPACDNLFKLSHIYFETYRRKIYVYLTLILFANSFHFLFDLSKIQLRCGEWKRGNGAELPWIKRRNGTEWRRKTDTYTSAHSREMTATTGIRILSVWHHFYSRQFNSCLAFAQII